MNLLFGKPVADEILGELEEKIADFEFGPHLAVILVGNDPASQLYVSLKEKEARKIGIEVSTYRFSPLEKEASLLEAIELLNKDGDVNGIIVQLPLPTGFDSQKITGAIEPRKDVDGFLPRSADFGLEPVFPRAIIKLLKSAEEKLDDKRGLVIANSDDFGRTMQKTLGDQNIAAGYILAKNIPSNLGQIKAADIVVSAVGSPGLLRGEMFKEGAIVIDGGIEKVGQQTVGDVDLASTKDKTGFLSPVPGGVGPVTIACLLENVYLAFRSQRDPFGAQQKEIKD